MSINLKELESLLVTNLYEKYRAWQIDNIS